MSRALFTEDEVQLANERRLKHIGAAKVSISQITFDPPLPRNLDSKNLDRLRGIFRKNRCRRLDVDNHVPAVVSPHVLADVLRKANISRQSLLTTDVCSLARLDFKEGQLLGLHGRHRLQVGAEVLPPADRWWTVDLYSDDIGTELKTSLVEEYANEKKPTDGEIYRKIRQYENQYDESFRERWFVRLSISSQERLDQLDNKKNRLMRGAFDRLLKIPGLWPSGMRISLLHRLIASGCVEEIISYLHHIGSFWSSLVAPDHASLKKIDQNTVEFLQLLAPGKSRTDRQTVCGMVLSGQAFAEFSNEERRVIWSRMENFDGLIPSLYTFFEDFKYLETCARCVKRLCGPLKLSMWKTMSSMFTVPSEREISTSGADALIQTSESTFRRQPATDMDRLRAGYLQIWLYAMRHYTSMPPAPKSDDDLLAKSTRAKPDERTIYEMAELAQRLGFQSTEISALIQSSPDHQIARSALLQARKPHRYRYDGQDFDLLVNQIVSFFARAIPEQSKPPQGLLADSVIKLKARAGEPQTRTHKQDGPVLFLDHLHADIEAADNVTSFFVRRCVYFAFFGKSAWLTGGPTNQTGNTGPDRPPSSMFVENDVALADTPAPDHNLPHEESEERQELTTGEIDRRQGIQSNQSSNSTQEENARRRERRRFQIRSSVSRPGEEIREGLKELEPPSVGDPDHLMLDRESVPEENLNSVDPRSQPEPVDLAMTTTRSSPVSAVPDVPDGRSDCTRVSLDAVPLVQDQDVEEVVVAEEPSKDAVRDGRAGTENEDGRVSSEPDPENNQPSLNEYLAHLRRAQEEQEQLEERLENERLHEELGDLNPSPCEKSPRQKDHQYSPSLYSRDLSEEAAHEDAADAAAAPNNVPRDALVESVHPGMPEHIVDPQTPPSAAEDLPTQAPSTLNQMAASSKEAEERSSPDHVEIQLWSLERGEWRRSDRLRVNPSDPSPLERVAHKYIWKGYSLYDRNLHNLRPSQCYRAATADGSNALFIVSKDEETKLEVEGRVVKEKELLSLASRVLDRVEDGREPRR